MPCKPHSYTFAPQKAPHGYRPNNTRCSCTLASTLTRSLHMCNTEPSCTKCSAAPAPPTHHRTCMCTVLHVSGRRTLAQAALLCAHLCMDCSCSLGTALCTALWAVPVVLRNGRQGWSDAKSVEARPTVLAQEHQVLLVGPAANLAHQVRVNRRIICL